MKRLYNNLSKVLLAVGCTVFAFICVISLFVFAVFASIDMYAGKKDAFAENVYRYAGESYAVLALSDSNDNFNKDKLDEMNCYYGIQKGHSEGSSYLYKNFDGKVPDNAYIGHYRISDDTEFQLNDSFFDIWGGNSITENHTTIYKKYSIQGIGVDPISQTVYVYGNGKYYQVDENYESFGQTWYADEESKESQIATASNKLYAQMWAANVPEDEEEDGLYIAGKKFDSLSKSFPDYTVTLWTDSSDVGDITGDNLADLTPIHDKLLKNSEPVASIENITTLGVYEESPDLVDYTFVCFPKESFNGVNDFYNQAKWFINTAESLKYVIPIIAIISFVASIACYVLYLFAIGHRKDSDELHVGLLGRFWTDLTFVAFLIIEYLLFVAVYYSLDYMSEANFTLGMTLAILGLFTAALMAVGLMWSANVAINVKCRRLLKHSLAYKILVWLKKKLFLIIGKIKLITKSIKWSKRIWIIYIVISIIEYIFIMASIDTRFLTPWWLLEKALVAFIIYKILGNFSVIINDALEERTRSERMKTELITNVSHDIKTPLTSIINYIDLLEKEDIKNDKAKEYLEVLSRQSARLKKLIEDLIEASKASTGNIKFNMETINATTLLSQSIGEFSERLEAGHINLVTDFPENEVYLTADNRYLWRVFDNLMSNIVKYAQADTRAYVDLKEDGDKVRFTFRNTSKNELNISAEELMERFVRGDKSRYTEGNGLGLSIAKSLVESMGGKLTLAIDGDLFKAIIEFTKAENLL